MYIVTRTFRDANGVFKVGSIIEPTDVKAFKSRLQQRHIINIDEQNIDKWSQFFINRYGIDLTETLQQYIGESTDDGSAEKVGQPIIEESVVNEAIDTNEQPYNIDDTTEEIPDMQDSSIEDSDIADTNEDAW